jgi:hypothetical protein
VEIRDSEGNSLELEERPAEASNGHRGMEEPMEMELEADTQH